MGKIIVVESPTKARTINRLLAGKWQVIATGGHLFDLPKNEFGVKIIAKNNHFEFYPDFQPIPGKQKWIARLRQAFGGATQVLLATDPDREGEAIAHQVAQLAPKNLPLQRIVFHEITATALKGALAQPRTIDSNLVAAQHARRILDRLVGYKLSPLLWQKIKARLSAGRVQSVALRLIVEREREREAFTSRKYWRIVALLESKLLAELIRYRNKPVWRTTKVKLFAGDHQISQTIFEKEKEANQAILSFPSKLKVIAIEKTPGFLYPQPPFTTAALQQAAALSFGWSSKKTMKLAQNLFEKGLITYHRTDSVKLATPAVFALRRVIKGKFSKQYLPAKPLSYQTKSRLAFEAHEAIRPTKPSLEVPQKLDKDELKLYQLIWKQAVASQMAPAKIQRVRLRLKGGKGIFEVKFAQVIFAGFGKLLPNRLPPSLGKTINCKKGEDIKVVEFAAIPCQTTPPPRYHEAALIKTLEHYGIGRPSTYAPIISTIQTRGYVTKEAGYFLPTQLGLVVNDFLVNHFPNLVDLPFTAKMEAGLDEIAQGKKNWQPFLSQFWGPFSKKVSIVERKGGKIKIPLEKLNKPCPQCQKGELIVRQGKFGRFVACSRFPDCRYTAPFQPKAGFTCPRCGREVVVKKNKKGVYFYACSNWPNCSWTSKHRPN